MANQFPNPDGRDEIEITPEMWENAEKMAYIQCTGEEIANILGISYSTLVRRLKEIGWASFEEWFKRYSAGGRMSLRRRQFRMSETNPTMAIWLGKQWLGQKDHHEVEVSKKPTKMFDTSKMSKAEYMEFIKKQLEQNPDDKGPSEDE